MSQYACLDELQTWLDSYLNFEKLPQKNIFWLDTMQFLCRAFGDPQNAVPAFHIAGSKGKGSVSAMIASILDAAGYTTGLYSSPHILDFVERIGSAHGAFAEDVYRAAATELRNKIEEIPTAALPAGRPLTWFELVTLYGFLCFRQAHTDYNVLEVGLGGRLDATNVVTPAIACITPIELEHTEFLGDTIAKIAAEKGGIIKDGIPVVIARQTDEAKAVLEQTAKERGAKAYFADEIAQIEAKFLSTDAPARERKRQSFPTGKWSAAAYGTDFPKRECNGTDKVSRCIKKDTIQSNNSVLFYTSLDDFNTQNRAVVMRTTIRSEIFSRPLVANVRLLGKFQAENAAVAAIAVKTVIPKIDERTIEIGLENATLPGRFEVMPFPPRAKKQTVVILDGAHTVNSVTYTLQTFRAVFGDTDAHLLFACAADKDMQDIAPLFAHGFSRITLTKPGAVKQSNLSALTAAFDAAGLSATSTEDYTAAIRSALHAAHTADVPLLVTGSFYLLAEVKKVLRCNV